MSQNNEVSVQEGGVKLGWSVIALLAALGFGMYMATSLNPVFSSLSAMTTDLERHEVSCKADWRTLKEENRSREVTIRALTIAVAKLENEIEHLTK